MAWTATSTGRLRCDEHGVEFDRGRSCPPCSADGISPASASVAVPTLGEFERMTAQAREAGYVDRVGLESRYAVTTRKGYAEAARYRRRADRLLALAEEPGRSLSEMLVLESAAQKWALLSIQASSRTDKLLRAHHAIVSERERVAILERQERLATSVSGPSAARARGLA